MRVPYSWLREYCDPGLSRRGARATLLAHAQRPRSSGSPTSAPPSADGFVVGRVLSVEQHPDADRLSVCEVETGDGDADDRLRRAQRRRRPDRAGGAARAR